MPEYRQTAASRAPGAGNHPTSVSDCAKEAWRTFANPAFKNQQGCENWVRKSHVPKNPPASAAPSPTSKAR